MLKIILLTTSLISSAFGAAPNFGELLRTDAPSGCPCRAALEKSQADRVIGQKYLKLETLDQENIGNWSTPVKDALISAAQATSWYTTDLLGELTSSANNAVDTIFALQVDITQKHPKMTLGEHYNFMTCFIGRFSQKTTKEDALEALRNLVKQHQGYAGVESGDAGLC